MKEMLGESFIVLGLSDRVRNDDPAAIGALWDRFRSSDIRARLGSSASQEVYCVYHDYDGGFTDPYRMTIGYRVPDSTPRTDGLYSASIPGQRLAVFEASGPQPQTLISQWQSIWQGKLDRAYVADFDVYDAQLPDRVAVHVGLSGSQSASAR